MLLSQAPMNYDDSLCVVSASVHHNKIFHIPPPYTRRASCFDVSTCVRFYIDEERLGEKVIDLLEKVLISV